MTGARTCGQRRSVILQKPESRRDSSATARSLCWISIFCLMVGHIRRYRRLCCLGEHFMQRGLTSATVRGYGRVVMTNSVPYGAFRGFGAPQSIYAIEMHMNRSAQELGIDPAEIRRRNFLHKGDQMPTGQVIKEEIDLEMMMDRALELSSYQRKRSEFEEFNKRGETHRRGIGLSVFFHGSGFTGSGETRIGSEVAMRLTAQGGVEVLVANVEYGQGTNTVL